MRISDWISDVCSSDLIHSRREGPQHDPSDGDEGQGDDQPGPLQLHVATTFLARSRVLDNGSWATSSSGENSGGYIRATRSATCGIPMALRSARAIVWVGSPVTSLTKPRTTALIC